MKAVIYHDYYGCDTGCCGHVIELEEDEQNMPRRFSFDHPFYDEEFRKWAEQHLREEFGPDHTYNLDWENCLIISD